jgi:putative FmdB family regulatory protein
MPTYDYVCEACDLKFVLFQSIRDNPIKKCPACGKLKLRRLFGTGAAIMFKGSGFYQTDYRSDSYRKGAEADKAPTAPAETKSDAKADTKAEKPSEAKSETKPAAAKPAATSKPKGKSKK